MHLCVSIKWVVVHWYFRRHRNIICFILLSSTWACSMFSIKIPLFSYLFCCYNSTYIILFICGWESPKTVGYGWDLIFYREGYNFFARDHTIFCASNSEVTKILTKVLATERASRSQSRLSRWRPRIESRMSVVADPRWNLVKDFVEKWNELSSMLLLLIYLFK